MKERRVKVAILGAGTAGLSARREVARVTDSYVVIDGGPLGTTCARVGCMPSKVLIQVANDFHRTRKFSEMGISGADLLKVDTGQVMEHVRGLRDRFVRSVHADMASWQDTHLLQGWAHFLEPDVLQVGDTRVVADRVIIATGSSPVLPAAWQPFAHRFLDTARFFEQPGLPNRVVVVGMGVIGLELSLALARLGISVAAVTLDKGYGGLTDPVLQEDVHEALSRELAIHLSPVAGFQESVDGIHVRLENGEVLTGDKVLLSLGRTPNLQGMGLEKLSLPRTAGNLAVDPATFRIPGTPLYLVGDVNGRRPILHEASDQGRIAGWSAVHGDQGCFQERLPLFITFGDPDLARVGKSWQELQRENTPFLVGEASFVGQGRAIVKGKEVGRLRLYARPDDGKVLGAELFAPDGEHLAHLLAWGISQDLTAEQMLRLPFYHPVTAEGIRTALRDVVSRVQQGVPRLELIACGGF